MKLLDWIMLLNAFVCAGIAALQAGRRDYLRASATYHLANFALLLLILSQVIRR